MNVIERVKSPTPRFFKKIRNIGLTVAAIGGAVLSAPVALPAVMVKVAGYLAVAGGIASAVSQVTCKQDETSAGDDE
jgi:uncharacterized membrane protein HdeD (DUF308 family)